MNESWSKKAPCNFWHRTFYWKELKRNIGTGCQGDWVTVLYQCSKCNKTIIGESDLNSYCPEVGLSNPPLTTWRVL